jgi:hypothetical protein
MVEGLAQNVQNDHTGDVTDFAHLPADGWSPPLLAVVALALAMVVALASAHSAHRRPQLLRRHRRHGSVFGAPTDA